jgi:shikimate dehydrogenase
VLHQAAYAALGLDWTYERIDCGEDELPGLLASRGPEWAGFSCTMPLKHAAVTVAGRIGPRVGVTGAANTLLPIGDGVWRAENTDVGGIVAALSERAIGLDRVVVLGAGGTAQAAVVALAELGVTHCTALVREPARAADLLATAGRCAVEVAVGRLSPEAALDSDLVISTLPKGAADPLADAAWSQGHTLLDVVYDPWPTRLASAVDAAGGVVLSGALMLLHQAAEQVTLMTGQPAPVTAMRSALRAVAPEAGL